MIGKHIVGEKIELTMTREGKYPRVAIRLNRFELHATKGWRLLNTMESALMAGKDFLKFDAAYEHKKPKHRRIRPFGFVKPIEITERMKWRHQWFRRQELRKAFYGEPHYSFKVAA